MAFLQINGHQLPTPKRGVNIIVSTTVDGGRNANGVVVGQRIGRDIYKIDALEWPWLTAEQWENILKWMKDFYFNVTFVDPVNNGFRTIKMYCGDRHAEPYYVDRYGKPTHYQNCKVNLIDTGG